MSITRPRLSSLLGLVAALAVMSVIVACGDEAEDTAFKPSPTAANPKDQAFLQSMVPHHMMAIDMAEMAKEMATKPEIKALADSIVETQGNEIQTMNGIYGQLFSGAALKPDEMAHQKLGLTLEEAGMAMTDKEMKELKSAKPFDRDFIDMMIPHHQGAIRMARVVLASTKDPGVRGLAQSIVTTQSREIADMNTWRKRWYGKSSPSGGVPTA